MASSSRREPTASGCDEAGADAPRLSALERALLDRFQRDFPLVPAPYAEIAARLGVSEETVLETLRDLSARGLVSRVGAVFTPGRVGHSMLAALAVPQGRLESVAALVSAHPEVNHNYEREHAFNLWFVVTGADPAEVAHTLDAIEAETGLESLRLPLERAYHIDLGFALWG